MKLSVKTVESETDDVPVVIVEVVILYMWLCAYTHHICVYVEDTYYLYVCACAYKIFWLGEGFQLGFQGCSSALALHSVCVCVCVC